MLDNMVRFLKHEYIPLLHKLQPGQKGNWGKMDGQQMIEHMRDSFKVANGKINLPLLTTDPEKLKKLRAYILTDGLFAENTKMPLMPEEPRPHKYANIDEAITKLEVELLDTFAVYALHPDLETMNPVFGALNYEMQMHFLCKHAQHHLRQFGLWS